MDEFSKESRNSVASVLLKRGWALIDINKYDLTENESWVLNHWEEVFDNAFSLSNEEKEAAGSYRTECGVSVGYRVDSEREFFESRIRSDARPEPNFPQVERYTRTVQDMYSLLNKIAISVVKDIAAFMGIDEQFFFDLTDLQSDGILSESTLVNKETGEATMRSNLSSSLLRICKYHDDNVPISLTEQDSVSSSDNTNRKVWFGAHTDSSFLTLSLLSHTPGLDIVDQHENRWISPELLLRTLTPAEDISSITESSDRLQARYAVVFVGEFLQVLSKHRFKAAVHRVRNFQHTTTTSTAATSTTILPTTTTEYTHLSTTKQEYNTRISCPYLIRGRHGAIIDLHNTEKYQHPGGISCISEENMPNLDGTSVKMLHKLLDLKRQRCFRENGSSEGINWVLSAYTVPPLPEENEIL